MASASQPRIAATPELLAEADAAAGRAPEDVALRTEASAASEVFQPAGRQSQRYAALPGMPGCYAFAMASSLITPRPLRSSYV